MNEKLSTHTGGRRSKFASSALLVFILASVTVLAFEFAEQKDVISSFTESSARLLICSLLLGYLVSAARCLPRNARRVVFFCSAFLFAALACELIEDIDALDPVPLVGDDSPWRHMVEKALVSCWTCGTFYLLYVLMRELEQAQSQIVKQERLSAFGQMASGIAHDLNNALTPVVTLSYLLKAKEDSPQQREYLDLIQSGAQHCGGVVRQLQHFYRDSSRERDGYTIIDLAAVIKEAVELTHFRLVDEALQQGIENKVRLDLHENCLVLGSATELVQVVSNLAVNAADAMPGGGCVTVSTKMTKSLVTLEVVDDGIGMSPEQRAKCFEPFYTTKDKGSGLGLSVCHGLISRHGGVIEVDAETHQGTRLVIELPRARHPDPLSATGNTPSVMQGRVLIIDDDASVRTSLSALLSNAGISVDTAADGPRGVRAFRERRSYDLVVTDLGMPGMTGNEVVAEVKSTDPNQPVAVLSGWSPDAISSRFANQDAKPDFILQKPMVSSETILRCMEQSQRAATVI